MAKFIVRGSGPDNAGAGWIGSKYFSIANQEYETDNPEMIKLLRDSKMAIELEEEEAKEEPIKRAGRPPKAVDE